MRPSALSLPFLSFFFLWFFLLGNYVSADCRAPIPGTTNYTFYVTFHGKSSVHHYNSTGYELPKLPSLGSSVQLRGMVLTYNDVFMVANGVEENGSIFASGSCGMNSFYELTNTELSHPYGLALGQNPDLVGDSHPPSSTILYSSNQNSLEISYHILSTDNTSVYEQYGVFGNPDPAFNQLRGLAMNPLTWELFAADEGNDSVYVFNQEGTQVGSIQVSNPIGAYINDDVLYVSSNDGDFPAVFSYDLRYPDTSGGSKSYDLTRVFFTPLPAALSHPTGIATCGDDLLVISQDNRDVLRFSKSSGVFKGVAVDGFDDDPEQILILNCAL